jgi:hypothetical protein
MRCCRSRCWRARARRDHYLTAWFGALSSFFPRSHNRDLVQPWLVQQESIGNMFGKSASWRVGGGGLGLGANREALASAAPVT